jgi:hypothetical protein
LNPSPNIIIYSRMNTNNSPSAGSKYMSTSAEYTLLHCATIPS